MRYGAPRREPRALERSGPNCHGRVALARGEGEEVISFGGQAKTFERVDDFPKLPAKFQEDDALEKEGKERIYSRGTDDGDYPVTNDDVWNDFLKEVNPDVSRIDQPDHVIFRVLAFPLR
jgi:hypothetical protein